MSCEYEQNDMMSDIRISLGLLTDQMLQPETQSLFSHEMSVVEEEDATLNCDVTFQKIDVYETPTPETERIVSHLSESIKSLPQASFIDCVIDVSNGCTDEISNAKEYLVTRARQLEGCPISRTIKRRKKGQETDDSFNRRLAADCYKLLLFIEGGPSGEIQDVFRPVSNADMWDKDSTIVSASQITAEPTRQQQPAYDKDIVSSLKATVQQVLERMLELDKELKDVTLGLNKEIRELKRELAEAKADHSAKRKEIRERNCEKENQIRECIENIRGENTKCFKEIKNASCNMNEIHDSLEKQINKISTTMENLDSKAKQQSRETRDIQLQMDETKTTVAALREPNDSLLTSVKNQVKCLKERIKAVEIDADSLKERAASNTQSITGLRERTDTVGKVQRSQKAKLEGLQTDINSSKESLHECVSKQSQCSLPTHASLIETLCQRLSLLESSKAENSSSMVNNVQTAPHLVTHNQQTMQRIEETGASSQHVMNTNQSGVNQPELVEIHEEPIVPINENERNNPDTVDQYVPDNSYQVIPIINSLRHHNRKNSDTTAKNTYRRQKSYSRSNGPMTFFIGNIQRSVRENDITTFFRNNDVRPMSVTLLPSRKDENSIGAKVSVNEHDGPKIMKVRLPEGIYMRKWYEREHNVRFNGTRTFYGSQTHRK